MGGDVWKRRLGPVAPEGADWMHFNNTSAALRYLHSPDGGALTKLAHTQVMRAAKTDGTRDGASASRRSTTTGQSGSGGGGVSGHRTAEATAVGQRSPRT